VQTRDFLQTLFPVTGADDPRANDLVRFISVDTSIGGAGWPGTWHWRTRAELHMIDEGNVSALGFNTTGRDVYFTPHSFTRQDMHVSKADASALLDCAWVELDDADIPPETFTPPPTITVETSPDRFHLYWVLDTPQPGAVVEKLNYRLTHGNGLKKDTSGWGLVKLLRVPGTTSYKRSDPFVVRITNYDPSRVYTVEDFNDLPEAPTILIASQSRVMPGDDEMIPRVELQRRYPFPKELDDLLDRTRQDRSQALWRMYNLCYQLGMTEEECFSLIRRSANDKFTDWRYNGEQGLWKDILRGYAMAHSPEDTPVLRQIKLVRFNKSMPSQERRRSIANLIFTDLSQHGRVYFDHEKRDALYYDGVRVISMDPTDRRWKALLNLRYQVTDGEDEYRPVNANLYALASANGEPITPRTTAYWDAKVHLLYVYNGGGKVYRLDGRAIDVVDNGTDGVLFRDSSISEPFEAEQPPDGLRARLPTLSDAILGLPNYEDTVVRHTREQAIELVRVWLYALFFAEHMEARPHLVLTGPTASGKTLVLQAISELLNGPGNTVSTIPHDRQTFETTVSNYSFVFFDNVDTPNRWLMDSLAEVATGIQFTRRLLYSTNESVTFRVQSYLGLTTRDPWFSRTDIATRLIVLNVNRREDYKNPTDLLNVVRHNRSFLWWELLTDLNKIVQEMKTHVGQAYSIRMAGFADFMAMVAKIRGYDVNPLIGVITSSQAETALDHSVIWSCLEPLLREWDVEHDKPKWSGEWISTSKLHAFLRSKASVVGNQREYDRKVPSARSLSHQLRELIPDLKQQMTVEYEQNTGTNRYRFTLPDDAFPGYTREVAA
jgi:hypothetical protein